MSWQDLLVECLLITACANLPCNGKVLNNEKQVKEALKSTSFLPRVLFSLLLTPSNQPLTILPYSQSETSATELSRQETTQPVNQITHSVGEAKIITTGSVQPVNQIAGQPQAKPAVASKVTSANLTYLSSQATIHTVVKTTADAKRTVRQFEPPVDQPGIYRAIKETAVTQRTTAKPEPPRSQKMAIPVQPATTDNANKTILETTNKHPAYLSKEATTNRATLHKNMTSVMTTAPLSTAPVGPTLQPKPSPAATGAYNVSNGTAECIKALIGLTMIVKKRNTSNLEYFNIDPNTTHTTGMCGIQLSTLNISFHGGFMRFTFTKNGEVYYVSVIEANFTVPSEGSLYSGIKAGKLFSAPVGKCFKCFSVQTVDMANNFQLLVVNSQLQAFDIVGNQFGKEEECALDRNKKVIPVTLGLSLAGLFVIVLVTCVIYRRKPNRGYDRI
ncbi:lysosome-associated membrane glycoprotein 3 [Elgaria multicarinata webbii]|uniref:lysosome-associated membrane glycoprotein 3 n=1 Tax=Elgaria multicarinata webbii TaxID=159646 RepID=UPI002FCCBFC5